MIVIDYSQVAISTLMAEINGRTDVEIEKDLIRHMILNNIRSLKTKFAEEYGEVIIAADNKHYWRKDKFPHYKSNRKKARQDSGLDWKLIFDTLTEIRTEIQAFFPYPVIDAYGAEADDVIATLAEWSQTNDLVQAASFWEPQPKPFLILSGDHDFIQLQRYKNVSQYAPVQKKWIKPEQSISYYLFEHIVKGDKGDGIPNILSEDMSIVNGIRQKPVTAKRLEEWKAVWKDSTLDGFAGTQEDSIQRHFNRNRYLIDFEYIPSTVKNNILEAWNSKPKKDKSLILDYLIKHGMKNLIDSLGDF